MLPPKPGAAAGGPEGITPTYRSCLQPNKQMHGRLPRLFGLVLLCNWLWEVKTGSWAKWIDTTNIAI
jgi:hypothetical protein